MFKRIAAAAGIAFVLGALLVPAAIGSVPKVVVVEEFGATW